MTVDDESMENGHFGNAELTSDEIKRLQQNMRYIAAVLSSTSDFDIDNNDGLMMMSMLVVVINK